MSVVATNRSGLVAALLLLQLTWSAASNAQTAIMAARPIIELEKTRFASKEMVFFWVGVTAPDDYRIPANLWTTCRLTITRPDETQRTEVVGWPAVSRFPPVNMTSSFLQQ
jgi:hypothetical protein